MAKSNLEIIDCEQGSDAWRLARLGIPTASAFATVLASGKGGGESKTRAKYIRQLAGEIIIGKPMESYTNAHMERGKVMETEARDFYVFHRDIDVQRVGFIKNGRKGCSPDSLIDSNGMLEIKTALPDILLDYIDAHVVPSQYIAQCQGQLWIAEREWVDLMIYWTGMKPFINRIYRDEPYISNLAKEIDILNRQVDNYVELHKKYEPA